MWFIASTRDWCHFSKDTDSYTKLTLTTGCELCALVLGHLQLGQAGRQVPIKEHMLPCMDLPSVNEHVLVLVFGWVFFGWFVGVFFKEKVR